MGRRGGHLFLSLGTLAFVETEEKESAGTERGAPVRPSESAPKMNRTGDAHFLEIDIDIERTYLRPSQELGGPIRFRYLFLICCSRISTES